MTAEKQQRRELGNMSNLVKGPLLQAHVLKLLQDKPLYGYAIMATLKKNLKINLNSSTVYPLLYKLEHDGLVISAWSFSCKRQKKIYVLTPRGKAVLVADVLELKMLVAPLLTVGAS